MDRSRKNLVQNVRVMLIGMLRLEKEDLYIIVTIVVMSFWEMGQIKMSDNTKLLEEIKGLLEGICQEVTGIYEVLREILEELEKK